MQRFFLAAVLLCVCCERNVAARAVPSDAPRTVVVWVSVDGLRHDYIERFHPPFLSKLQREGAYTTALVPVFPSLTFSSHTSEATGAKPAVHGIVANAFYDEGSGQTYKMSDESALVQSEPIWITAARQHVRVAMGDWPFSYKEAGPVTADYFGDHFDTAETDDHRMQRLWATWHDDATRAATQPAGGEPLRLIMGYVADVDHAGHRFGPDAPETKKALDDADELLGRFHARCVEQFAATMRPDDELYFLVTTDHGMSPISTVVNIERLLGKAFDPAMRIMTSGSTANIYLDQIPEGERVATADRLVAAMKQNDFLDAWTKSSLPERFGYAHPTRTGEVIVSLHRGYSFGSLRLAATRPADGSQKGTHGYDPESNPDMLGFAVLWRYHKHLGGIDLGRVDSLQLHPTVAKLLGIHPAPNATAASLNLPDH